MAKIKSDRVFREGRFMRLAFKAIGPVFLIFMAVVIFSSCTFKRMVKYGHSEVYDYRIFAQRPLLPAPEPYYFKENFNRSRIPRTVTLSKIGEVKLEEFFRNSETLAFLVLKNDELIYEKYFNTHKRDSLSMSFSMAKSFTSFLIGCAIADGYIKSVDQPVTDFVPELKVNGYDKVTIEHLLQMTSGMKYKENDNPFGIHPRFYWTEHLEEELVKLKLRHEPGTRWSYKSGENQLLALVLKRALKNKTVTRYMQEKIWTPLGMEYDGVFSTDRIGGLEKTFCCISARARDYLKIGRLYLNKGNWNGVQVVPEKWVERSTIIDESGGSVWYYQYQWWILNRETGAYRASGHLGQYLYIDPANDLVILRLGTGRGHTTVEQWKELLALMSKKIE